MFARDLITLALQQVGAVGLGQPARPEYLANGLTILNMMLAQWSSRRWLVFRLEDVSFPSTGALFYTIGPGGDVDVPRPDRLEAAFARLNPGPRDDGFILDVSALDAQKLDPDQSLRGQPTQTSIDYPLDVISAREDYNLIGIKGRPGFPQGVFYEPSLPLGTLYFVPVPNAQFELHITVKQQLGGFASLDDPASLPDEYLDALLHNLTIRLAPMFQVPTNPTVVALALSALNTIRNSNTAIPRLRMPAGLPGFGRVRFGWGSYGGYGGYFGGMSIAPPAAALPTVPPAPPPTPPVGPLLGSVPLSQITLT